MPLTKKGKKVLGAMQKEYGSKKGKSVMYAMKNAGKLSGIDRGFYGHMDVKEAGEDVLICGGGWEDKDGDKD